MLLLTASINVQAQQRVATHVVLITVDGFRPEFYLDSTYGMHTVRHLMQQGVAAKGVDPVFPSVTYPDHTTMVTGVTPAKHGIVYNTPFEAEGQTGKWLWDYNLIKTETLWSAMQKAGRKTACVRWPVTLNAPIDYCFPEYWDYKNMKDARPAMEAATTPRSLWKEIQDSATGFLRPQDLNADDNELVQDETAARIASYLIRQYKPGFLAVHLACTDHYEHQDGRESYMVRAAVAGADRGVKSILEALNRAGITDSTLVIVTGDHGFENIYRSLSPNYLLKQNGLITDVKTGNWKAQFHSQGGSAFLQLKDANDQQTVQHVRTLLKNLPDSIRQYFTIVEKELLTQIGADPNVPLALTGLKGTTFGAGTKKMIDIFKAVKGTHGFFPDHKEIETGFVAVGPGLKKGIIIPKMKLMDVAPVIVKAAQIPFAPTDGKYPAAFFE
ncbi:Predicted pyrophosphatase or phosphodiesterase, AlkP superfamily [Filimonas lacunae]|uniref:Predicted pyrophosphatase or phosphodiesterase, AlkP superfamily n=2 Tax=Filimonas lacunae TaxID=477680 RepID=A0A1N7R7I1_9BACT|nr:Predicted pyrophosphatase or phosphodiesterase, AlkP superfamily [Filimonas lacunae]